MDISSPTFYVPEEVDETTTYEYLADGKRRECGRLLRPEVTVTVLNRGALSVVCLDPAFGVRRLGGHSTLDCSASGAPAGSGLTHTSWTAQGEYGKHVDLLTSGTDISSPTFYVPDEVDETTTYEYLLTASAENMERRVLRR